MSLSRRNLLSLAFSLSLGLLASSALAAPEAAKAAPAPAVRVGKGTVKWFNEQKGFGFIAQRGGAMDLYFDVEDVVPGGAVQEGAEVEFEIAQKQTKMRRSAMAAVKVKVQ